MKQVFTFTQSMMNGTVTAFQATSVFATRELAEQVRRDLIGYYERHPAPDGLQASFSDVGQTAVYETKDQVPFYKTKED